jgi:hypothetical protein
MIVVILAKLTKIKVTNYIVISNKIHSCKDSHGSNHDNWVGAHLALVQLPLYFQTLNWILLVRSILNGKIRVDCWRPSGSTFKNSVSNSSNNCEAIIDLSQQVDQVDLHLV